MKKLTILIAVLLSVEAAQALQMIPPEQVLRRVINSATSKQVSPALDLVRIMRANPKHDTAFVSQLLLSLNTEDLLIKKPALSDLTICVLQPRKVSFDFEPRQAKRLGGGHYTYYVIVAICQEVSADVRDMSISLFGDKVGNIAPRHVSAAVTNLCPGTRFYTATIKVGPNDPVVELPTLNPPRLFAVTGNKKAEPLSSPDDICSFLGNLHIPVTSELMAYQRALVFAELLGGTVLSKMPNKESIIAKYRVQKQENWPVVIRKTKSGWNVAYTLMTDRGIQYCVRYTLNIQRDGKAVRLAKKETVYTYTLYE